MPLMNNINKPTINPSSINNNPMLQLLLAEIDPIMKSIRLIITDFIIKYYQTNLYNDELMPINNAASIVGLSIKTINDLIYEELLIKYAISYDNRIIYMISMKQLREVINTIIESKPKVYTSIKTNEYDKLMDYIDNYNHELDSTPLIVNE